MKNLILILVAIASAPVFSAEGKLEKKSTRLPFHQEIDSASEQQNRLTHEMRSLYTKTPTVKARAYREEGIVADFIDHEMHIGGKQSNVVDRRTK